MRARQNSGGAGEGDSRIFPGGKTRAQGQLGFQGRELSARRTVCQLDSGAAELERACVCPVCAQCVKLACLTDDLDGG